MHGRSLVTVIALGATLTLAGCTTQKEGSGVEASEARDLDAFSRISLSGETDVVVTVGDAQGVSIRGDDNLLADVETDVDDDTLEISDPSTVDLEPKAGITVEITVPELEEVTVSGSGDVRVEGIGSDIFRAEVSGSGKVEASGEVQRVDAEVSGSGDLELAELASRDAIAEVSGSGSIHLHATESLDASVSGSGDIVYAGDPPDVESDVSGSGDIRPA
jgi:hypothetical protein